MNRHASMNRIFRLVWSESLDAYVPAAETARGRGKRSKRKLVAAALALTAGIAQAGPTGGQVTGGNGNITQSGSSTTIDQSSQGLALNWRTFNIGSQETVNFVQPNAAAVAVNRILDPNGSVILGHLNANGQVYLINPNGVLFGKGAEVNVGGLVASTLDLGTSELDGSTRTFSGSGTGSVINQGTITASNGGSVALLANHVSNNGVISAQLGTVALGAGSAATLTFGGTRLVSMQVNQSVLNSEASNGGLIRADGGTVLMNAGAQKALLASVVNNTGVIEARTIENHEGTIILLGGMAAGTADVQGTLDASAAGGGNGGTIETSAARVKIESDAKITTAASMGLSGTWTIDPTDFTIAAGSAAPSTGGIGATTLQGELANGNVSIATSNGGTQNGDINVDAAVSWAANKLTLTSANDINVNAVMTISGSAKVDFEPGSGILAMGFAPNGSFAGRVDVSSSAADALTISGHLYTIIDNLGSQADATTAPSAPTLQGMAATANLHGYFALGSDIDASSTSAWNNGAGFKPVGDNVNRFAGTFEGLGHTINNLTVDRPTSLFVGLFGFVGLGGELRNVGMTGGSFSGTNWVAPLAGFSYGDIIDSFATSNVTGAVNGLYIGGLAGNTSGRVIGSHATGTVTAGANSYYVGGLVGNSAGTVDRSYATGNVSAGANSLAVGGLVGKLSISITSSYATGAVSGANYTGGLVGVSYGTVTASHASGSVNGASEVGGLVGYNTATTSNSYALGSVSGTGQRVGGLVGASNATATESNTFATGTVTAAGSFAGGLIGWNYGNINNSYAVGMVSGAAGVGGLVGGNMGGVVSNAYAAGAVSSVQAGRVGSLMGFNYGVVNNTFYDSASNPNLSGFPFSGADSAGRVVGLTPAQMRTQANFTSATAANGGVSPGWDFAGTWVMYEGQTNPLLRTFMTPLTIGGTVAQTYNGTAFSPTIGNLTYSADPDFNHIFGNLVVSGNAAGAVHAGTYTYTPGGLYSDQLGYIFTFASSTLTINPATLTVSGSVVGSKVYDGTTVASLTGGSLVGLIGGDVVALTQTGNFASKNVGTGLVVTASDSLSGANAGDYVVVEPAGLIGTITPASLTVSGTLVGSKVYDGTTAASLTGGSLIGLVSGDSVTLNQSGTFASANAGTGIAVTATDALSGSSSGNYSLVEPSGLTGSILPASGSTVSPPGPIVPPSGPIVSPSGPTQPVSGPSTGSSAGDLVLAALNARTQVVENFIYPQFGAKPQVINSLPTIAELSKSDELSMKIGATGTLKIENGGLRLPSDVAVGDE